MLAGLTAATVAATTASVLTAGTAFAAVPAAPDNLLVFPNRDFITIEGYQGHKGETPTVEATRGGTVVGSAQGVVSGDEVAFEINHLGGVCRGAGTGVNVTPDIQPGDVATIKFGVTNFGDTTVQGAGLANVEGVPTATTVANDTLIVEGLIGTSPPRGGAVSAESAKVPATVTAVTDTVAISKVTWKAGDQLRVVGSSTLATGQVSIYAAAQDATG